jgi:hypothetical protein
MTLIFGSAKVNVIVFLKIIIVNNCCGYSNIKRQEKCENPKITFLNKVFVGNKIKNKE